MNHRVFLAGSEIAFDCAPDQSVLDAALRAGIELPYSCRKGVCGNCAGGVASGEVAGVGGASIRNETCTPDQVLYCMCAPVTDVVLQPTEWKRADPSARKAFTGRVYKNQRVAHDVSLLQLRLPAGQRAKFRAGQYLQVLLDDGSARCYSMANPPQESDAVTLHIRHVAGGRFSTQVGQLAPGDTLRVELPFGSVALQDSERPIVFVAGGTGFAPVKSIIDDMARRKLVRPITLIWGARTPDGIYLAAAVERWKKQWPQSFRFIPALSDVPAEDAGDAFCGRVDEALAASCGELAGHEVYCCGSPPMVAAVREAALAKGLAHADFHADVFVPGPSGTPSAELAAIASHAI
ncbi:FAD-binding oxidoreductase [Piscinibacter koreensis]|uniref:2Fe-2S iron-sulfur cluster binding domain-containing protein n=1 Tax=Piscinibacter koreensis TaxID=2742824 RepID=A0A7Y6NRD8_9BURK|nr:FAD-binding oxidoreductase [Schlegelella koreensis]NUZ07943.1 2Fe-2S iron-sulfur cluster binding domain-containing protein [Schlegelella koreensis]